MHLIKKNKREWLVLEDRYDPNGRKFYSIEEASQFLEEQGVDGDEIDTALIVMAKFEHSTAYFGIVNGTFIYSE